MSIPLKKVFILLTVLLASSINLVCAEILPKLNLQEYEKKNGAITLRYKGDFVDPYFAMRALLTANEEGMDVKEPALRWINWLIKQQRADGRFDRYCLREDQFIRCMDADSDDINMILWAQLLTLFADSPEMPQNFQQSYAKSMNYLENELYIKELGIYRINKKSSVALFMDNVEIAHAFFQLAQLKRQQNKPLEAAQFEAQANHLVEAIERVFARGAYYEVSTQPNETKNFYPGAVAQIYPWIFPIPWKWRNNLVNFVLWYYVWNINKELSQADFAWGMVAIAAKKAGNDSLVNEWLRTAENLRPNTRWNVLEEIVYQILHGASSAPNKKR